MAFGAVALILSRVLIDRPASCEWPSIGIWVLGFAFLPWIQWLSGISLFAGDAVLTSYFLLGWSGSIFLGYHLAQDETKQAVLSLMHALWVAAMVSAVIGLIQWLKLEEPLGIYVAQTDFSDPAMGNLAQPNQLATLLLMGIVAFAYLFERRIIGAFTLGFGVLFMTWVLVMTHSRAGMLGLVAISTFFLIKRASTSSDITFG